MKTFLLAPDSFKGTISAARICEIEAEAIRKHIPDAVIHAIPMADGGEGMVEAYLGIMGGERITVSVTGPLGEPVEAVYGILPDGSAVMEMAAAAGLPLVEGRKNPMETSTYGVGEMLLDAERRGIRQVLLGLGGSSTNDCGIGMAAALGFRFLDENGNEVEPKAKNLGQIHQIQAAGRMPQLEVRVACDVDNPLLGPRGATYTFGPQKGATPEMQAQLEAGMSHYAEVLEAFGGRPVAEVPGAGAAGGMGAAVMQLLNGRLMPGAEMLLESVGFDRLLQQVDVVWTGEGRIDWQSAFGKVPGTIGKHCQTAGVPCLALCGAVGKEAETLYEHGITAIYGAVRGVTTMEELQSTAEADLAFLADAVVRQMLCRN